MSFSDDEKSSLESSDDTGDGEKDGAMMSILSSYYGIESEANNNVSAADLIDSPLFNSAKYVEELMASMTVEKLVAKDTNMIHEIRALDSDMQMLVYENYNKFISATETIKRMKTNVEAMDGDMEAVRMKMGRISKTSHELDLSLASKRAKIDKLVRVRRLLQKLEFLSELPEKLVELINSKQYKRAVQLYAKTITVLTRHSHLLSFKKIKERTEQMMADLRVKVMNLLDEPNLEAVKLTHYVSILCLMEAPKERILEKLLSAHRTRSLRMMAEFEKSSSVQPPAARTVGGRSVKAAVPVAQVESEFLSSISRARKFHQTMMVGLIEACRGVNELFHPKQPPTEQPSADPLAGSKRAYSEVTAYLSLYDLISELTPQYTRTLVNSLLSFYSRYKEQLHAFQLLESRAHRHLATERARALKQQPSTRMVPPSQPTREKNPFDDEEEPTDSFDAAEKLPAPVLSAAVNDELRVAQLKLFEMEEEKTAWMQLCKQTIFDWELLDSTLAKVVPQMAIQRAARTVATASDARVFEDIVAARLTTHFAASLLGAVEEQVKCSFRRTVLLLAGSIGSSLLELLSLAETTSAEAAFGEVSPSVKLGSDPLAGRYLLQRTTTQAKVVLDATVESCFSSFSQISADSKAVFEIRESSRAADGDDMFSSSSGLVWHFCVALCSALEKMCGLRSNNVQVEMDQFRCEKEYVPESFEEGVLFEERSSALFAPLDEIGGSPKSLSSSALSELSDKDLTVRRMQELWSELNAATANFTGSDESSRIGVSIGSPLSLLFSVFLRKLCPVFVKRINHELQAQELQVITGHMKIQDRLIGKLDRTAQQLLLEFVGANNRTFASFYTDAMLRRVTEGNQKSQATETNPFAEEDAPQRQPWKVKSSSHYSSSHSATTSHVHERVADDVISFGLAVDRLAVFCCIFFSEPPPQLKAATTFAGGDREFSRRASVNRRASAGGVQLDIERLFSQRIVVMNPVTITATLDSVVGTVLKAAAKSALEYLRLTSLSSTAHLRVQVDSAYLKQLAAAILKDSNECDRLVEQVTMAAFSRYTQANDIANAADTIEQLAITRIASEALQTTGHKSVLLPR